MQEHFAFFHRLFLVTSTFPTQRQPRLQGAISVWKPVRRTPMTAQEIVEELRPLGIDSYKKTMLKHGAREPIFGVKIEEMKKIQKRIKKDYQLALDLYDTGISDAMYL